MATSIRATRDAGVYYPSNNPFAFFRPKPGTFTLAPTNPAPITPPAPIVVTTPPATPAPAVVYLTKEATDTTKCVTLKQLMDDGAGVLGLPADGGTVNYTTGVVRFKPTSTYRYQRWNESRSGDVQAGSWSETTDTDTWGNGSLIRVWYREDSVTPTEYTESFTQQHITLELTPYTGDSVVPGSVMFTIGTSLFLDRDGEIYRDPSPTNGSATLAGTIDYSTGRVVLTDWTAGSATFTLLSLLTQRGEWSDTAADFRTAGSPVRPASLYVQAVAVDGELLTGTADTNGVITGTHVRGEVEQTMGVAMVEFGALDGPTWVPRKIIPSTLRYNTVVLTNLPLEASILGLDPVRLPQDGRVPIYRPGDVVVVHNTQRTTLTNPVTAGSTYSVGREDCAVIRLEDATGAAIADALYSVDPAAGEVTISPSWTGAGIAQPLTAVHRIEDMSLLADVQINGQIDLSAPLLHDYPTTGTYVSSALLYGDMQAYVTTVFDQQTWTGVWSDALIGSQATAQYNDITYPIEVLNESAVTERWRIAFTSTTAFQVIGENLGVIATGNITTDCAPVSPVTGEAYFVIRWQGWGGGWATGNQLRFNTVGANGPTWIARTILAGASLAGDSFDIEARGDVD